MVIQPLSTRLIKPNFCFDLSHRRSTTVSLETRNSNTYFIDLIMTIIIILLQPRESGVVFSKTVPIFNCFFFFLLFSLDFGYQGQLRDFSEVEPLLEISCFLSREVFLRYCIIYGSLCLLFWENNNYWISINSIVLILRKCLATAPTHMLFFCICSTLLITSQVKNLSLRKFFKAVLICLGNWWSSTLLHSRDLTLESVINRYADNFSFVIL